MKLEKITHIGFLITVLSFIIYTILLIILNLPVFPMGIIAGIMFVFAIIEVFILD